MAFGQLMREVSSCRRGGGHFSRQVSPIAFPKAELFAAAAVQVALTDNNRVDVPDRVFRLLDDSERDNQCVDKFFEVVIMIVDTPMQRVVLHHVGVGLVVGSVLTTVVMSYLPLCQNDGNHEAWR